MGKKLIYIKDQDVWEFACSIDNFSEWVRCHLRKEMIGGIDPMITAYIDNVMSSYANRIGTAVITVPNDIIDPEICGFF